jgi:hypothetical protein
MELNRIHSYKDVINKESFGKQRIAEDRLDHETKVAHARHDVLN